MTNKQRALNAMLGLPTDRTSVHPAIDVSYAAGLMNKTVRECFIDPVVHARALENVFSVHPCIDGLYINLCLSPRSFVRVTEKDDVMQVLDYGGMLWTIPGNDVGTVSDHEIRDVSDERMKLHNPLKDGINDTFREVSDEIKQKYLIIPGLTGPFSQVVFMLGLTETLMLIYEEPGKFKQALEWRTVKALEWADELMEAGAESVWIGEGAASSSIISPDTYSEFVLPYATRVATHLRSKGAVTVMHVCGDINTSVDLIAKTGVDALDIDYMVNLGYAREKAGRPVCLRGNLNPVELLNMPAGRIKEHCMNIISSAGSPFVLSTGCLVARDTPPSNVEAMVEAARCLE